MKVELETKFNIGDRVWLLEPQDYDSAERTRKIILEAHTIDKIYTTYDGKETTHHYDLDNGRTFGESDLVAGENKKGDVLLLTSDDDLVKKLNELAKEYVGRNWLRQLEEIMKEEERKGKK